MAFANKGESYVCSFSNKMLYCFRDNKKSLTTAELPASGNHHDRFCELLGAF